MLETIAISPDITPSHNRAIQIITAAHHIHKRYNTSIQHYGHWLFTQKLAVVAVVLLYWSPAEGSVEYCIEFRFMLYVLILIHDT